MLAPSLDETDEGMMRDGFSFLADVEDKHFWFRSRNILIGWLISTYAPTAERAIEIGCGTGYVLHAIRQALPNSTVAASELHTVGLLTARQRHGADVELFQMDARRSGLREAVDLVGAFDVLEHIPEDEEVLADIARMLRPGGVLIATVPQHPWMWSTADDLALHQRRYRRGELAAKARKAGLESVYESSFVTLAFPLMAAARILERLKGSRSKPEQHHANEFRLSPTLNGFLLHLCRAEQRLRELGVPLPFGGSQVIVARRA